MKLFSVFTWAKKKGADYIFYYIKSRGYLDTYTYVLRVCGIHYIHRWIMCSDRDTLSKWCKFKWSEKQKTINLNLIFRNEATTSLKYHHRIPRVCISVINFRLKTNNICPNISFGIIMIMDHDIPTYVTNKLLKDPL